LEKIYELDIELVLPGHRGILGNCKKRIQELKNHHQNRLKEIISILEEGSKNAFKVASRMSWDIIYDTWNLFLPLQKWFATGEAIAHLKYLEKKKIIRREMREKKKVFSSDLNQTI
jgi:hypothetical protein